MRSELVFAARHTLGNRFTLCHVAAKATRKFHRANTRIQDTTNEVLQRIAESDREPAFPGCENDAVEPPRSARSFNQLLKARNEEKSLLQPLLAYCPI